MQDALPAFVLNSEAIPVTSMDDTPHSDPAHTAGNLLTDKHLMLDFSQGKAEAFTRRFDRYKQPGVSAAAWPLAHISARDQLEGGYLDHKRAAFKATLREIRAGEHSLKVGPRISD